MVSYEQRADQAISEQRWQEASNLLTRGIESTPLIEDTFRMQLRRATLPLYQDAVNYEAGNTSQLTDATTREVHEEAIHILLTARKEHNDTYGDLPPDREHSQREKVLVGALAELSMFNLCMEARVQQYDEVLVLPSTFKQDHAENGLANDLGMYNPAIHWHNLPRTSIQTKHLADASTIQKYDPSVVVVSYKGRSPLGIDTRIVTSDRSISAILAGESSSPGDRDELLNRRYRRLRSLAEHWPEKRKHLLANDTTKTST